MRLYLCLKSMTLRIDVHSFSRQKSMKTLAMIDITALYIALSYKIEVISIS